MNVKRIVVDRIPHSCSNCQYVRYHQYNISGEVFPYACGANRISKQIEGGVELYRPEWCPLELEEVCEWKFWWTEEYSGDPEDTPDSILNLITVCEWDYPELTGVALDESGDVAEFMMRVGYDYCPNCGKRIVYKESEE